MKKKSKYVTKPLEITMVFHMPLQVVVGTKSLRGSGTLEVQVGLKCRAIIGNGVSVAKRGGCKAQCHVIVCLVMPVPAPPIAVIK